MQAQCAGAMRNAVRIFFTVIKGTPPARQA
jgi:hypothetical protein